MTPSCLFLLGVQAALLLASGQGVKGAGSKNPPAGKTMEVVFEWNYVGFAWPSEKDREEAIRNKEYYPNNVTIYDFDIYEKTYFVTTPRIFYGCPATLSTISDKKNELGQYLLEPYPDWESNRQGNCDELTSVYRIIIDEFERLWALDSGNVDVIGKVPDYICQPQIVLFNLAAGGKIVCKYHIPDSVRACNSLYIDFQVDIRHGRKDDVFVYIVDVYGAHIVVFDVKHNTFHRVTNNKFLADPHAGDFYIAGTRLFSADGIHSLVLGPVCNNDRRVYFHAYPSFEECWVMASTLRNKAYVTNERAYPDSFYCYGKKRDSQSAIEAMTHDGIMFFDQEQFNSVSCWNTNFDYNMQNTAVVARNDTTMQATEVLKVIGADLYGMSIRLQLFTLHLLQLNETNFRVLWANINYLIRDTTCVKPCP